MEIVLDTNIVFQTSDRRLRDSVFESIRVAELTPMTLVVPEIVILETVNRLRCNSLDCKNKLDRAIRDFKRSNFGDAHGLNAPSVDDDKFKGYEQELRTRLNELNAEIPDHSDVPHAVLIDRALCHRKPFNEHDCGYRDALIWEVILRKIASNAEQTIFITNNWKDFCRSEKGDELHPDLKEDMLQLGLAEKSIEIISSLDQFEKVYMHPSLQTKSEVPARHDDIASSQCALFNIEGFLEETGSRIVTTVMEKSVVSDEHVSFCMDTPVFWSRLTDISAVYLSANASLTIPETETFTDEYVEQFEQLIHAATSVVYETAESSVVMSFLIDTLAEAEFITDSEEAAHADVIQTRWYTGGDLMRERFNCFFSLRITLDKNNGTVKAWDVSKCILGDTV